VGYSANSELRSCAGFIEEQNNKLNSARRRGLPSENYMKTACLSWRLSVAHTGSGQHRQWTTQLHADFVKTFAKGYLKHRSALSRVLCDWQAFKDSGGLNGQSKLPQLVFC